MTVVLRAAAEEDVRFVWEVNNHPSVRALSFSTEPIPWETHQTWFARVLADPARELFVIEDDGERAGVLRLDNDEGVPGQVVLSIAVAPGRRGRGVGRRALEGVLGAAKPSTRRIVALVRPDNEPSLKVFERAGFERDGTRVVGDVESVAFVLGRDPA